MRSFPLCCLLLPGQLADVALTNAELGANIAQQRKAHGIKSQVALAKLIGVSTRTVTAWENGENGGAWDYIRALEDHIGNVTGLGNDEPSYALLREKLRQLAVDLDVAREVLHALAPTQ